MNRIYHITTMQELERAARVGKYVSENLDADGFIHCAYAHQLASVAESRFRGRAGLALLEIDPSQVGCPIRDERAEGASELFPHVYGALPMAAISAIREISVPEQGRFALPCNVDV